MRDEFSALVVDDEVYAVEGILQGVRWAEIGITQTYSAHSMQQAIEVMKRYPVDILLCDIEMPKGSGLDLLQWATDNAPGTVCIFLTSHANFAYAKTALQLGSIDYILKPIPYGQLTQALQKAVDEVEKQRKQALALEHATYWNTGKKHLLEQLVADVVLGHLPPQRERILQEMASRHLPGNWLQEHCTPVLLEFLDAPAESRWDTALLEYGLRNMLAELVGTGQEAVLVSHLEPDLYLLTLPPEGHPWRVTCQEIIDTCGPILERDLNGFLGQSAPIEKLRREVERLQHARLNNLARNVLVEPPTRRQFLHEQQYTPALRQWEVYYELGQLRKAEEDILHTLEQLAAQTGADSALLKRTVSLVEHSLRQKLAAQAVPAERLFGEKAYAEMAGHATKSVQRLAVWLHHTTAAAEELLGIRASHPEAVQQAQRYIQAHLSESMTRGEIAAAAYLSPDYLSHLFKVETGRTLSEYIMNQRMQQAQKLLRGTDMPVFNIALAVGYANLPYFSKLFRRCIGVTPTQYRQQAPGQ